MVCDGASVTPIADQKLDRTFSSQAQNTYYTNMSAAIDPINSLYVVSLPSTAPTTTLYIYSYLLQRWTTAKVTTERLISSFGLNYTLEDLDAIYSSIDAMTSSLDSAQFKGGRPVLMMYDGSHMLGSLSGANAAATFVDCRREFVEGRRSRLMAVRPLTNASSASVLVYGRNAISDTDTLTTYTTRTASGVYRTREAWNLMQVGVQIPANADWTYAQGIDADVALGGRA